MNTGHGWPRGYEPARSPVFSHNEIRTSLPPERLWPVLIDAANWPRWYSNSRNVSIEPGYDRLGDGRTFHWTTFGLRVTSTVREFLPPGRLAWDGRALGSRGYHRWEIRPAGDGGSVIVTEEVQRGLAARLIAPLMRRGLHRQHQRWLEGLVRTAERAPA
ncbi:SRPBCC domain-containing protein [Streptomyces sp. WMMB 322]|uniref:SRPBCC domain-containing protein n=1 Tax=Streptomyces sp. WMMB 322 TaxID=1286821 RepID=UPI0006E21E58|nr:SRPBCC domain-containing protein [Streptomyces sp. WMMB 322]SCK06182.1 Polyketide cyclase / dehydrase and lipid transport [Streptomyces sp. WMMB 322]